jgi:hypothetical protein
VRRFVSHQRWNETSGVALALKAGVPPMGVVKRGLWSQRLFHFLNATRALQGKVLLLMRVGPLARVDATTDWAFLEHTMKQLRSG